jgi:hypothetical protein
VLHQLLLLPLLPALLLPRMLLLLLLGPLLMAH